MYKLSRAMLVVALLTSYLSLVAVAFQFGGVVGFGIVILLLPAISRHRNGTFTEFGTARWADANDLRTAGMLGANEGLIIGRVADEGGPPFRKAQRELFSSKVPAK